MAALIVAGSILLHNKIKDKKEARREKKRQAYEERYNELQREHTANEEKYLSRQKSGDSRPSIPGDESHNVKRRNSQSSLRSVDSDGPSRWVDEAAKTRIKS